MQAVSARLKVRIDQAHITQEQMRLYDLANRCASLSKQIFDLLEKVKPRSSTASAKYYSAFQVWRKEDQIQELEKSLESCRNQLILGLVELSSQNSATYSKDILALIQDDSDKFKELQTHMDDLKKALDTMQPQINQEGRPTLRQLVCLHEEALTTIYQHRILESLKFEVMHQRDDRVHDPYGDTFGWMFQDDDTSATRGNTCSTEVKGDGKAEIENLSDESQYTVYREEREAMMTKSRRNFSDWLLLPGEIFHITGKLGSGKSTLMKFLYSHPCTHSKLRVWAGERYLIIAPFFFWNLGLDLQKSINGLYRSLLYDILKACPSLIQDALPAIWDEMKKAPWKCQETLDIPSKTIKTSLERLLTEKRLNDHVFKTHCFCFFIDGLDEHEEISNEDHRHLVGILNYWVNNSNGNLKMCVSSRDYNVFLNGLPEKLRLWLPDLTEPDMRKYVGNALSHLPNKTLRDRFIDNIPLRAKGIFLWTVLVTAEIRRQIENETSEKRLLEIIDSLPSGLITLFQYILNRLDANDRRKTPLNLANFALLDHYNEDEEFSIQGGFPSVHFVMKWNEIKPSSYTKQLRGSCGGLVECRTINAAGPLKEILDFSHRSIPDILRQRAVEEEMEIMLGNFNSFDAFSHLLFAQATLLNIDKKEYICALCASAATIRLQNELDKPPYRFLEIMDSRFGSSLERPNANHLIELQYDTWTTLPLGFLDTENLFGSHKLPRLAIFSVLYLAMAHGHFGYVKWKIMNSPSVLDNSFKRELFVTLLIGPPYNRKVSLEDIDYFFQSGLLTENFDSSLSVIATRLWLESFSRENHTYWERYLSSNFLSWCGFKALVLGASFDASRFSHIVMRFLEHGASTDFSVMIDNYQKPLDDIIFDFKNIQIIHYNPQEVSKQCTLENVSIWLEPTGRKTLTLRQWIEALDLKDKSYILQLLDRDKESQETHRLSASEVTFNSERHQTGESDGASDTVLDVITDHAAFSEKCEEILASHSVTIDSRKDGRASSQWLGLLLPGKLSEVSKIVKDTPNYI
ncbi:hypothetical protein F53441_13074 [Fusarium austroafricanum]|uniref:Nephrocystin 3-like N-terminal domain-containing protein n=1 Tax=Fusarium austroafricanum TaxID=2364996 RepID=A0A8H4JTM9_9HYPO|nr:hypothetical protein F53441_13074 [Fusarium austroafricanum]